MKTITIASVLCLLAHTVSGAAIPLDIEERQIQPISTVTGPAGTSYIYALASPIPDNIASQLAAAVSAVPTSTTVTLPDGGVQSTSVVGEVPVASSPAPAPGAYTPGYRNIGYYGTWYIFDRKFVPSDIITSQWTHIMAGFWDVGANGQIAPKDPWSDIQSIKLPNPSTVKGALNGVFEQMFRLKNENRNLKVMLSVGGWLATSEGQWGASLATPEQRNTFAKSAARAVMDLGLDGIDLDWEYPRNDVETAAHVDTLRLLRQELDAAGNILGVNRHLLLSMAAPIGAHFIKTINIPEANKYVDFFNLMVYDMGGAGFSKVSTHAANFFMATDGSTEFCFVDGFEMYLAAGVPASKLNVLDPIYGHSFAGTDGPGTPFTGPGVGSWGELGTPDYNQILQGGDNVVFEDEKIMASWTYNKQTRQMISFDTPRIIELKTQYLLTRGVGGIGFFAINADKWTVSENLVNTALEVLGGTSTLEQAENHIIYKDSQYPNVRVYDGVKVVPGKTLVGAATDRSPSYD
ncbi:hypothetical protein AOL_s00054g587 [Orbilia oligospora ATCC 24927]|uniref:chitinase n=2 Tax=Orbilia oligospora TaxID=2813651 RepID=G1X6U3_ARTOA|nr:hypothetical protein AOL_s00054g587 [Orbilia oligospora ATCC 24927]EGX51211.1 hypothetical protein AOL_s00054g587 [Orbilia oligospora ATCC 24927]KAF3279852.1 hypothetical protein TWF970_003878 [Orbilia oligospora]